MMKNLLMALLVAAIGFGTAYAADDTPKKKGKTEKKAEKKPAKKAEEKQTLPKSEKGDSANKGVFSHDAFYRVMNDEEKKESDKIARDFAAAKTAGKQVEGANARFNSELSLYEKVISRMEGTGKDTSSLKKSLEAFKAEKSDRIIKYAKGAQQVQVTGKNAKKKAAPKK